MSTMKNATINRIEITPASLTENPTLPKFWLNVWMNDGRRAVLTYCETMDVIGQILATLSEHSWKAFEYPTRFTDQPCNVYLPPKCMDGEYVVRCFKLTGNALLRYPMGDYFTEDAADAQSTFEDMCKRG